jgi:sulfoquinovosidase
MVRGNFRHQDAPSDEQVPRYVAACRTQRSFRHEVFVDIGLADQMGGDIILNLAVGYSSRELLVQMGSLSDYGCSLDIRVAIAGYDRIGVDLVAEPGEHVWGGGQQLSYLDLRGREFPIWASEPGVGREPGTALTDAMSADGSFAGGDYWTTNYPEPTFLSSRKISFGLSNSEYVRLDSSIDDKHRIEVWSGRAMLFVNTAGSIASLVGQLAEHREGLPPPLPDWAIGGAIIGLKEGEHSFARLERIVEAGTTVSALWCEDWCGIRQTSFGRRLFWDWQWQPARYPDLPERMAALKAQEIKFLGYVNPYLAADGPLFAEAAAKGYFARQLDSDQPYLIDFGEFDAGVVDFTNPAAAGWFAEEIIGKRMLDFGLDGWMADFGEYLPVDLRLYNGDPMVMHNLWPVLWAEVNYRAVASRGKIGEVLWFMRAGFTGVHANCPLLWAGDQSVDFSRHDGIGTVITAALSAGLVGNAFSHSDIGGYTSLHGNVRTDELLYRWYELGAFTPVMRTHEGNRPEDNLQIDSTPALLRGFARWSRVHAELAPWARHLCEEASATGLPAQRALFLHYPDDRETFTIQDQYLYGADLMVAPVIEEGATARRVYLPGDAGTIWRHVWSGVDWTPGWHEVPAPIGEPPVFFRPESDFAALFASLPAVRNSL